MNLLPVSDNTGGDRGAARRSRAVNVTPRPATATGASKKYDAIRKQWRSVFVVCGQIVVLGLLAQFVEFCLVNWLS